MKRRKQIKKDNKPAIPIAGVFQIENTVNGKLLVEESTDIHAKWNRHRFELRFGGHRNKELQQDWNDQEDENFVFKLLSELEIKQDEGFDVEVELKLLKDKVVAGMEIKSELKY